MQPTNSQFAAASSSTEDSSSTGTGNVRIEPIEVASKVTATPRETAHSEFFRSMETSEQGLTGSDPSGEQATPVPRDESRARQRRLSRRRRFQRSATVSGSSSRA